MATKNDSCYDVPPPNRLKLEQFGIETKFKTLIKPAPEERWWFPIGSITRDGEGAFFWHSVSASPEEPDITIVSGLLVLDRDTGYIQDENMTFRKVEEDPSEFWYNNLEPFPFCHFFYDPGLDSPDCILGLWLCIHGHYSSSRDAVSDACSLSNQE
jgi:hypothetical protein